MSLNNGTKLGPYEILAAVGAGGMGEVYRATDTRLSRTVAIKVLPSHVSDNEDLRKRFEREAKAISSLQHPNICTLFDVGSQNGVDFLVMEYLEGETLAQRLSRGGVKFDEALKIAVEILDALDAAHRQGIVHRDLKPGNVILTKSGAKLMDFGLAKTVTGMAVAATGNVTPNTPTMSVAALASPTSPLTQKGSVVGTFQYIAPEVLQGEEADARSDIFSFGCVLYEMLAGRRPFDGKTQMKVLSAILEDEPTSITEIRPELPARFNQVVAACLAKDREARVQCVRDLRMQLDWLRGPQVKNAQPNSISGRLPWIVAAALLVALFAIASRLATRTTAAPITLEAEIGLPSGFSYSIGADDQSGPVVLSPDGKMMAFVGVDEPGSTQIFVRELAGGPAKPLAGTDSSAYPFWSTDGKSIGFFSRGLLRRISATGGPVLDICAAERPRGGAWLPDDTILFAPNITGGIFRVSSSPGSTPREVVKPGEDVSTLRWPVIMPDGKHFVYLATNHSDPIASSTHGFYFATLDGKENKFILPAESNAAFSDGRLFWVQGGTLMSRPFDPSTGAFSGETAGVVDSVAYSNSTWRAGYDVKDSGVMVYQPGIGVSRTELALTGRDGKTVSSVVKDMRVLDMRISRDGRKAAVLGGGQPFNIWIADLQQGTRVRTTFDVTTEGIAWSPDNNVLYYSSHTSSNTAPQNRLLKKVLNSNVPDAVIMESNKPLHVSDVSADGKLLLYEAPNSSSTVSTTYMRSLVDGGEARLLIDEPVGTHCARFSPDGKWVLYQTTETGRYELYATSVLKGGKQQLTSTGGFYPRWSEDSKSIYYLTLDHKAMELPITLSGDRLEAGTPKLLFKPPALAGASFFGSSWDSSPDGKHFLLNLRGALDDNSRAVVLLNWQARLKK